MSRANKNHPYDQDHLTGDGSPNTLRSSNAEVVHPRLSSTPLPNANRPPAFASRHGIFFRKYFLGGQRLDASGLEPQVQRKSNREQSPVSTAIPYYERHQKFIAFIIPFVIAQAVWLTLAVRYNFFRLFITKWEMAILMVCGAIVAGVLTVGGGAVAFPVMTLFLHIDPIVARDFSLMIQSCVLICASFMIIWMRLQVELNSVLITSIGATVGTVLGLNFVDELLTSQAKTMLFVSIWFSFAISCFLLNRQRERVTHSTIPNFRAWKAGVLLATGLLGGLCTAFAGSGVDICSFSVLTLLFRVSEKVATPTSVLLMAANSLVGFYWRQLIITGVSPLAWEYFKVAAPVVVLFAPLGIFASSHLHRQAIAAVVYALQALALFGFLITHPSWQIFAIGASITVLSALFFLCVSQLSLWIEQCEAKVVATEATGEVLEEGQSKMSVAVIVAERLSHGVDGRD